MKLLRRAWPLMLLLALAWLLFRPTKAAAAATQQNPGGLATDSELAYSAYLTNGDGSRRMDFSDWVAAGKPSR